MHEGPVTEEIIRIACEAAAAQQGRVTSISLVVGEDSGFIGESIQMYFDVMSEGTICEGAVLHLEGVKSKLRCAKCGQFFYRRPFSFTCPACGGDGRPTEFGKEFYVKNVELEVAD